MENHITFMKKISTHSGSINIIRCDGTVVQGYWCEFPPRTYPSCNDYTKYEWDWNYDRWVLTENWKRRQLIYNRREKLKNINEYTYDY